jgi:hypothetical protein
VDGCDFFSTFFFLRFVLVFRLATLIYAPRLNTGAPTPAAAAAAAAQQAAARAQQMSLLAALQQHQPVQQAPVEPAKPAIVTAPDLICTLCTRLFTVRNHSHSLRMHLSGYANAATWAHCVLVIFLFCTLFSESDGCAVLLHELLRRVHPTGAGGQCSARIHVGHARIRAT